MIATITTQHPTRASQSSSQHSRDSNRAGAPLPIIPRRTTRSQSLPIPHSSTKRPVISSPSSACSPNAIGSDSSSSDFSEGSLSTFQTRSKGTGGVRTGTSSPPRPVSTLSSPQHSAVLTGLTCQPRTTQGVLDGQAENLLAIAAPRPLVYTPGMLRLSLETMRSHMAADSHPIPHNPRSVFENGSKSAPPQGNGSNGESRLITRKKSSQPIKSSLKSSRCTRGSLSVVTMGSSSKSEPSTPKVVHFDPQLERVRLFLTEQKPLAVSRDGSPTEDVSGTDGDFPSFIYGDDGDATRSRKRLVMQPITLVSKTNTNASVALEDFYLNFDGTNVLGKVRVRNIAFAKTVVVRFTFDSWQTTSEVTARYVESINHHYDRFSFSIRLNDLLPRIEGKTLVMAIRYNVAGQEFWDNNYHRNYVATFTKAKVARASKKSDDEDASDVENLRSRLERVALHGREDTGDPVIVPKSSMKHLNEVAPPSLKSGVALSSRYDFATSLRKSNTWKPVDVPVRASPSQDTRPLSPSLRRTRASTCPVPLGLIPWPEKVSPPKHSATLPIPLPSFNGQPLVSPRDFDEERLLIVPRLSPDEPDNASAFHRERNHRRGFSADAGLIGLTSAVKRTPPGTPISKPSDLVSSVCLPVPSTFSFSTPVSPSRRRSFPPLMAHDSVNSTSRPGFFGSEHIRKPLFIDRPSSSAATLGDLPRELGLNLGESSGDSELSTPSPSTPTSSRSPTPSPTDSFMKPALPPLLGNGLCSDASYDVLHPMQPISPGTHYKHFLSKFCFFTGSPSPGESEPSTEDIHREGLPQSQSEVHTASSDLMQSNASSDDVATICGDSGASTPTIPDTKWGSRETTPVPP